MRHATLLDRTTCPIDKRLIANAFHAVGAMAGESFCRFCRSLLADDSLGGIEARSSSRRDLFDVGLVGTDPNAGSKMVRLDLN